MDISQIRQAALNSLYAHRDHLDSLRKKNALKGDNDIEVIEVAPPAKPSPQPTTQTQCMTIPTPPALPPMLPLARQAPTPYPRQHAPPPPVVSKPTFLGLLGGHPVYQSVFDLRRLGLRFDEILQQSGCSEEFLRDVFKQLGYSIESVVAPKPAPAPAPAQKSPRAQPVMSFAEFKRSRSELNTPTPPIGSGPFPPAPAPAPVRTIPRFGEKSRRQKRLCIEISDSESDSEAERVVSKKHKDMSLEETRLEIARIQALIAQQSASSRNGTPISHEDSEVSEESEAALSVDKSPITEEVDVKLEPVIAIAPLSLPVEPSTPSISPEVQAYLNAKNIALESLSAVQLDKIVQIVKLKTLLQGEEDAFTTSLKTSTPQQPVLHKIPPPVIPSPAPRQLNPSEPETGADSTKSLVPAHQQQPQQDQPAHVQQEREIQDSSYRSPLAAFRSHKFGPFGTLRAKRPLHVDRESPYSLADTGDDTISLAEFKPSELPLCPYELQGVCNDSKCDQYAHWRDLRLSKNERILEIMRAFVGDSLEEQKQYKDELNVRLKQLQGADFDTIVPALTQFRNEHITDGHFLDWYAFNRVDVQN
ncbi:hypothetical protein CJU89_2054 [Yarrowia sp. B02]|nr:hypothetical protein CJU89_2054 [Yarrowia sp. B02]